jgi:hypothetical protein
MIRGNITPPSSGAKSKTSKKTSMKEAAAGMLIIDDVKQQS